MFQSQMASSVQSLTQAQAALKNDLTTVLRLNFSQMQEMAGKMATMNENLKEAAEVQQGAIESLSE